MRLTRKKVEEIVGEVVGTEGLPLVKELYERQNISEFELANKTKKDIKIIRRLLYTLYNHNLVSSNRKKDKDKGWYIYYWTLVFDNIKFLYFKKKREHLARLQEQLIAEKKELFFVCPKKCVRLNFDQAMDFEFHCPECGELTVQDSGKDKVEVLQRQIKELEQELKEELREQRPKRQGKKGKVSRSKGKVKKEKGKRR